MKQKEGAIEYLLPSTLGIGLVKAYDRVGLENSLTKPHLRRLVSPIGTNFYDRWTDAPL
jgi:DNA topoisomerase-3